MSRIIFNSNVEITESLQMNGCVAADPNSTALGINSAATGARAYAQGASTLATGNHSSAIGWNTEASGDQAHAQGSNTLAKGANSHAAGLNSSAEGQNSFAQGYDVHALGQNAHATGSENTAYGLSSVTEGTKTKAMFDNCHAEGYMTIAGTNNGGNNAHAEGYATQALGSDSHAQGNQTKAIGENSTAMGYKSIANKGASVASGVCVTADAWGQTTVGRYNSPDTNALFVVGSGTSESDRKNILTVGQNLFNLDVSTSDSSEGSLKISSALKEGHVGDGNITISTSEGTSFVYNDGGLTIGTDGYCSLSFAQEVDIFTGRAVSIGTGYGNSIYLDDGDISLSANNIKVSNGKLTIGNIELTAEKLAKIIKFIDSIEEVTE